MTAGDGACAAIASVTADLKACPEIGVIFGNLAPAPNGGNRPRDAERAGQPPH
jgi:hypothetical protein